MADQVRSGGVSRPRFTAAALIAGLSLAGCIPVPERGDPFDLEFMSRDELRQYSETVFRRHNRVATRLMLATDSSERDRDELERAERRMNEACASLNRIASMRAAGEEPGLELENRVRRDVRLCEHTTVRVEELLDRAPPATADPAPVLDSGSLRCLPIPARFPSSTRAPARPHISAESK